MSAALTPTQRQVIERSRAFREAIAARAVPQSPPRERPYGVKGSDVVRLETVKPRTMPIEVVESVQSADIIAMKLESIKRDIVRLQPTRILIDKVIRSVADYFGFPAHYIVQGKRTAPIVRIRHIAMYLAREFTGRSTVYIGRRFRRDHTVIMHAHRKIKHQMLRDEELAFDVAMLIWIITGEQQ